MPTDTPADPSGDLPDLSALPDLEEDTTDPVLMLQRLVDMNAGAMNNLTAQGVELRDAHTLVSNVILQTFVEEILRRIGGEIAVVETGTRAHEQIRTMLAGAEQQITRAKLTGGLGGASAIPKRPGRE